MDGWVPGICDLVGYDVPLDTNFKNKGAPRFRVQKNELTITFGMIMEMFKSEDGTHILDIDLNELEIKFKMNFDPTNYKSVTFDWEYITLKNASVTPFMKMDDLEKDDQHLEDYFNWSF